MNVLPRSSPAYVRDHQRGLMYSLGQRWARMSMIVVLLATLLAFVHPPLAHADAVDTPDTALDTLWNTYGNEGGHWTGGDSTVSVPLPDGRIAWLFSDTFLGTVNSDYSRPSDTPFIHNSLVVQQGSTLTTITGGTASAPTTLVQAQTNSSTNWDWVDDGLLAITSWKSFTPSTSLQAAAPLISSK